MSVYGISAIAKQKTFLVSSWPQKHNESWFEINNIKKIEQLCDYFFSRKISLNWNFYRKILLATVIGADKYTKKVRELFHFHFFLL